MSKYITEKVIYPCREQPTEVLLYDADTLFRNGDWKGAADILLAILCEAVRNNDQLLINDCLERQNVMRNQFCSFKPDYSAANATDNNNRPLKPIVPAITKELLNNEKEEDNEEWDSSRDGIFNKKIKPQAVKKAISSVESEKITDRPYYYVAFTILKILKYIPQKTSPRDFLLWVNLHFNCGWSEDPKKKQLYFRLEGIVKKLSKKHPSEWKDDADNGEKYWGNMNIDYYNLAISFKNVFTMAEGGSVDNSESFEHLRDRVGFLSGAIYAHGLLWAPDDAYINDGK